MAGAGWQTYATGDLIDATTFQTFIQDQVIQVYADSSARDTALGTNDAEGMFCFLKDSNTLQFYDGSSWVNFIGEGDITGVTAGTGLSGGGSSGAVTVNFDPNSLSAGTVNVANDSIAIIDADDSNNPKKESIADFVSAIAGSGLTASSGQLTSTGGVSLGLVLALS